MWELAQCQLPMEIRIGLTVSMTGSRSHEQTTSDILSTLRELQSLRGNLNEADTGVPFQFCLQFCVMDDESLPWKAVEHYRVFANFSSFDESMDMLLGPATYDFRAAVAQVSDENRWPLLLWSMFPDLGLNPVVAQQTTVSATASWIRALLAAPPPKILKTLFGALPENMSAPNTCETFTAPENYTLRPLAKLLPCDGPCQAGRDLDYCAVEAQTLAVTGNWSPADALRHGGWRDGCLNGSALANVATFMDLTLFFERTAAPVVVYMSGDAGTLKIGPQVFVASPGAMWLRTGTSVTFEAADEDPSGFSICLRQSCDFFQCQAPYSPLPPGSFCNGLFCGAEDFEHCCTLERQSAVNGPIWANSFHSLLDMSVPPTRWLQDALPRLLHPRTQLMVCVSQDLFRDLCRAHVEQAVEIGFRTTSMLSVTEEGASLQQAIVQLQLMRPAPSLVLVCGDMGIYSRFIHGLIANSQTFYWVMSCFPFGRELQGSVKGSQLAYNFLEPMPWPPLQQIEAVDQAMAEIQEAIAQTIPGLSLASLTSQQPNLNMQMLALRAAVQMLYQAVYKGMTSWFLYQTSTVGVLQPDGANTSLQDGGIDYLVTALKTPLKISSFTHDTYFTYFGQRNFDQQGHVIASRYETGLRQFIPLANISEISKRDPVKIKGSWRYNHARHLFSSFREFSFDETLEPNRLDFLSNKLIYTYPCPAGCVVVGLDCSACPPGFFRQASGVGCAPCPANASVFYNFWAGPQCFPCPHGSRCDRPDEAPVALPGYLLLADPAAKTHQAVLGMDACSTAPGGGLADIHAKDVDRWYELKAQTFWIVEECFPQTACAGQNQCAQFHYGDKCSICSPGSSKFEGYFCRVDCAECPQVAALVFQTLVLAAFQVISILLLSLAIRDSAWNVHSISGPVVIALLRALLIHAVLSKMALEPLTTFEIQELHVLLWFSTLSQAAFSPCTLPLIGCLRPLESLEDLNIYLLFALASFASTTLLACLISVCTSSRRWDALIRTAYAALQITVPSLSFYSLYLMQCDGTQLYKQRDMACPDLVNLGNGYVLFHIIVMFLQWLSFPYIIKNAVYVQVQERYGIAVQKMLVGRRYWKVLDDIILSTVTLAATSLREEGILYAVLSIQTAYAILIENLQPYSYLGGNGIVNTNRSLATSLACLCAWLLFEDFVLSYIGSLFDVSLRTVQLVTKSIALSLGLLHIWVIFLLTALESRVGLVLNMNSRPSSRFTLRLSRLTRCFASSYSMLVQRKSGGQLVFDARHIPKRFRMVFMQGVASAVNFILHRNSILRIVDVRNMVSLAVEKILEARHINLMFGLNAAYARSLSKGEVDEPDEAFAAILGSELIAAYELVSAIEDMCSGYFSSPGRKEKDRAASDPLDDADEDLISKMEKEGFGTQGTMPLATPKKATVFALRRQTAKDRFDKRLFEKAQADCLKAVESILPKVEQLQRQLTEMWLVSDNDHDRLVPAFIDKVESLCSLLKEVKGFFNDERDDQEMEHFLSILHTQLRALDTDISQDLASKAKASKAKQRRSSLRGLDAESLSILGSREDAALLEACEDPPIKPDIKDVNANQPSRPSAFLSFNHLDFRNPLQPAPACAPALDRVFEE